MAGVSSIQSKLKKLETQTNPKKKYQSVVYSNEDGSIDWPDNPNPSGVMVVPKRVTIEKWEREAMKHGKIDK